MRSLQVLQRSVGNQLQAGSAHQAVCGAAGETQTAVTSLIVPAASNRALSAIAAAVEDATAAAEVPASTGAAQGSDSAAAAAAESDAAAQQPRANGSSSDAPTTAAAADQQAAVTTSSSSSSSSHQRGTTQKDALLKTMGIWVAPQLYNKLPNKLRQRLMDVRRLVPMLQTLPSGGMAAAAINPLQLQTVVTPAMDYGSELGHPLVFTEEWVQQQAAAKAAQAAGTKAKQAAAATEAAAAKAASKAAASSAASKAAGSGNGKRQKQQQKQQQHRWTDDSSSSVVLSPASLVSVNTSELMVNLNAQMANALSEGQFLTAVNHFDNMMDQAVAAALRVGEEQQQRQQQVQQQQQAQETPDGQAVEQQGERDGTGGVDTAAGGGGGGGGGAAAGGPLLLPAEYRPDHDALVSYCRAVQRASEQLAGRYRAFRSEGRDDERSATHARALRLYQGALRAKQLWGPDRDKASGGTSSSSSDGGVSGSSGGGRLYKLGGYVHMAYLGACKAAAKSSEGVSHWAAVHPTLQPDILHRFWRLHYYATACALQGADLEAAHTYALPFAPKDQHTGLTFRKDDYIHRIGPLMEQLALKTARAQMWDAALHWLQALIDHDALVPVQPANFLVLLRSAAFAGQMPIARVMIKALDDQLKLQSLPTYLYSEYQIIDLLEAAGRAGDVPFIEQLWERLTHDVKQKRSPSAQQQQQQHYGHDADAALIAAISGGGGGSAAASGGAAADTDAAAAAGKAESGDEDGSPSSSASATAAAVGGDAAAGEGVSQQEQQQPSSLHPSQDAHLAVVRALVACGAYGKAFEHLHAMEQRFGAGELACSVYHGLRFFPESLDTEQKMAAAYAQLQARKDNGQPVSTTMVNVITRGVARLSSTEAVGKVFNSYEDAWGVKPDVDSYNAVMEACEAAGRVAGVQGVMALMTSRNLEPNTASWNLLLSTAVRAGDIKATTSAINRMREAGIEPSLNVLSQALQLAHDKRDMALRTMVAQVANSVNPKQNHRLFRLLQWSVRNWQKNGSSSSSGGGGGGGGGNWDRWDPSSSSSSSSSSSHRSSSTSSSSNSSKRDVWRPRDGDESDGGGGSSRQQQRWQQRRNSDAEWGISSSGSGRDGGGNVSPPSGRVAQLRALMEG